MQSTAAHNMSKDISLIELQRIQIARAVASDTRLAILKLLLGSRKPIIVGVIAEQLGMTHSAISHQLKLMSRLCLVCGQQLKENGRYRQYWVDPQRKGAIKKLIAAFELL